MSVEKKYEESDSDSDDEKGITVDCDICADEVLSVQILKCPFCSFSSCKKCIGTFLMGIDDDKPRCMNLTCKKVWSFEFLAENFPPSFYNIEYRNRRASLLHDREKSLLPGTQNLVRVELKKEKNKIKLKELAYENAMLLELINQNTKKIYELRMETREKKENEEKKEKVYTRACPVNDCRGFLSKSRKCGLCETYACKHCLMPKACKHDENHECDPDLVATIKLMASDTKPCPSCSTPIFKIHGCDQMYCTQCHTPFSWTNGTIDRGVIHNPHYYEMQRLMNNGNVPRVAGDVQCGGLPTIYTLLDIMERAEIDFRIGDVHRLVLHINYVVVDHYPNEIGVVDNSKLRVDYLMGRITENQWVSKLKAKMKKQEKNSAFNQVLAMFTATMTDLFGNIVAKHQNGKGNEIANIIANICVLRDYTNKALAKIGNQFGNTYPGIRDTWEFATNIEKAELEDIHRQPPVNPRFEYNYPVNDETLW